MNIQAKYYGLGLCVAISVIAIIIEQELFGVIDWLIESDLYNCVTALLALTQLAASILILFAPPRRRLLGLLIVVLLFVGQASAIDYVANYVLMGLAAARGSFAP